MRNRDDEQGVVALGVNHGVREAIVQHEPPETAPEPRAEARRFEQQANAALEFRDEASPESRHRGLVAHYCIQKSRLAPPSESRSAPTSSATSLRRPPRSPAAFRIHRTPSERAGARTPPARRRPRWSQEERPDRGSGSAATGLARARRAREVALHFIQATCHGVLSEVEPRVPSVSRLAAGHRIEPRRASTPHPTGASGEVIVPRPKRSRTSSRARGPAPGTPSRSPRSPHSRTQGRTGAMLMKDCEHRQDFVFAREVHGVWKAAHQHAPRTAEYVLIRERIAGGAF